MRRFWVHPETLQVKIESQLQCCNYLFENEEETTYQQNLLSFFEKVHSLNAGNAKLGYENEELLGVMNEFGIEIEILDYISPDLAPKVISEKKNLFAADLYSAGLNIFFFFLFSVQKFFGAKKTNNKSKT